MPFMVRQASEWLRNNVFTPFAILREMDLAGGTLSYEGLEVLRAVETKGKKCYRGSVIPRKVRLFFMVSFTARLFPVNYSEV
jgi:hypothetical protein